MCANGPEHRRQAEPVSGRLRGEERVEHPCACRRIHSGAVVGDANVRGAAGRQLFPELEPAEHLGGELGRSDLDLDTAASVADRLRRIGDEASSRAAAAPRRPLETTMSASVRHTIEIVCGMLGRNGETISWTMAPSSIRTRVVGACPAAASRRVHQTGGLGAGPDGSPAGTP